MMPDDFCSYGERKEKMRLIDADKLLEDGIRVEYGYNDDGLVLVPMRDVIKSIKNAPTVDVAKEIFKEFGRFCCTNVEDWRKFEELKKKYMEDGHEISLD